METLPDVTATGADGRPLRLRDLPRPLVIYFYPKDDTPGCTREAQDFSALAGEFAAAGVSVLGVSRDDVAKHATFTAKHALTVALASDLDGSVTEAFGVWGEKKLYGKTSMGIVRSTFIIDEEGRIARVYDKVKVAGHVDDVLESL